MLSSITNYVCDHRLLLTQGEGAKGVRMRGEKLKNRQNHELFSKELLIHFIVQEVVTYIRL